MLTRRLLPPPRAPAGREAAGLDPPAWPGSTPPTRRSSASAHVIDFEDLLLLTVGDPRGARRRRRADPRASTATSSSTSTRTSTRCSSGCSTPGSAAATTCASSATRPDDLLLRRRDPAAPARLPRAYPRRTVVRLVRDYRSTPQVVGLANRVAPRPRGGARRSRARARWPSAPRARPGLHRATTTSRPRPRASRRASAAARRRAARAARSPCCTASTPSRRPTSSALAEAGVPYVVRGGERFFDRPEVREPCCCCAAPARSDDARRPTAGPGPRRPRRRRAGPGSRQRRRRGPRAVGVPRRARRARRRPLATDAGRPLPDFVAELDERAAAPARPDRRRRHARVAARRQGPGVGRRLPRRAAPTAPADHVAETPEAIEEERRLLYVGITRAREHLELSWRAPARPAAGHPTPVPLPGRRLRPRRRGAGRPAPAGRSPSERPRRPSSPRAGLRRPADGAEAARGRCAIARRPTTRRSSSAEGLAAGRGAAPGAGLRRLHRRDPDRDRRERTLGDEAGLLDGGQASATSSWPATAAQVLAVIAGADPEDRARIALCRGGKSDDVTA